MSSAPDVRYCTTSDGVRIAYTSVGAGPPVLLNRAFLTSVDADLSTEAPLIDSLSQAATVWLFDHGGMGASQRAIDDFSLEAQVRELEAVAPCVPEERFILIAVSTACASAAAFATTFASRVEQLICIGPSSQSRVSDTLRSDWSLFRRVAAGWAYPDGPTAMQKRYSRGMADSVSPEVLLGFLDQVDAINQTAVFAGVPVPTLILADRRGGAVPHAQALAAATPDGRLAFIDDPVGLTAGRMSGMACLVAMGLRQPERGDTHSEAAVVLFTDIADSTALTEGMGDAAFRDASRALDAGLRAAIRDAGGAAIEGKLLGDGVLATFPSAAQAIDGARRCLALSAASELGLHIGLHAGDVIREEGNVFGGAVNIASRICGLSAPGEILVSDVVRGMARSSAGVEFEDRGEQEMKGVGEPVRVYAVVGGGG